METNTSETLKTILKYSTEEAMRIGNDYVGVEHVLLGMLRQGDNKAVEILGHLGVEFRLLRQKIEDRRPQAVVVQANNKCRRKSRCRQSEKNIRFPIVSHNGAPPDIQ